MSAREQLFAAYAEWREWTEREGEALRTESWPEVERCQIAKAGLQRRILQSTDAAQAASRQHGPDWATTQREISALITQLIALEHANAGQLAGQRAQAEARHADLGQASRNLRRVHGSYGGPAGSQWHSYS